MEPLEIYQKNIQDGVMNPDAEQMKAVLLLQSLFESDKYCNGLLCSIIGQSC